jgi:hypothetical protein
MKQPHDRNASATPGIRPAEYVVEGWVSQQLKDKIRRLGAAPADPGQAGAPNRAPEPELEAEP